VAKLTGILLILLGCAGALLCWIEGEKRKQAMMEEWLRLFVRWEYALRSEHVRLYDFLENYETGQPELGAFLKEVCQRLRKNIYPTGQQVWLEVLEEHKKRLAPSADAYEIIVQAKNAFFCGSSTESLHTIRICRRRMEECIAAERTDQAGKRRIYVPAGMLGGVVLIILLV
jgi:hypothetical protein